MALDISITDRDLPVLSVVATQALQLLRNPNVTNRGMEELIRQDPALTQRLLHTANSPFYAGRRKSQSISEAVFRLGHRQLRNVLMTAVTGELFNVEDPCIQALWDHSIVTAIASHLIAEAVGAADQEEAFIAGMMHDIGKVVIYRQHPAVYTELLGEAAATGRRAHELEHERFQFFTHMSIGGLVVRKWNLSDNVAEATRFHHEVETENALKLANKTMTCVVSLASLLANTMGHGISVVADNPSLENLFCAQTLRMSADRLNQIQQKTTEAFDAQRATLA